MHPAFMAFNSLDFLVFFPLVVSGYFVLPQRARWLWLLSASCLFYMAFIPAYILILFFTIIVDYGAGIFIERAQGRARKVYLGASIVANIGILAVFKYYAFLNENVAVLFRLIDWSYPVPSLGLILPIGLSFHTFQALSYTIEVYRGNVPAERHLGIYSLYVMFFPQLVAGPIERPQNLLHQFRERHRFEYQRVVWGLQRMAWGMFKKVVIADRLAFAVNRVYGAPQDYSGPSLMAATVFFAIQIYCDFSGYSDIALGAAEVMGFRLMENFRRPYFSGSISEFWTRWHISLSSWFRDYVYIPLGGNRGRPWRWALNVMIVFMLSGLWHGASWTFVVWGALNGFYLLAGHFLAPVRRPVRALLDSLRVGPAVRMASVFTLLCVAWVFFRARTIDDALLILRRMATVPGSAGDIVAIFGVTNLAIVVAAIGAMELVHVAQSRIRIRELLAAQPAIVRWPLYSAALLALVLFGFFHDQQAFIYFQF
jgi:D-alanyl-lipoteichoic acid acyltransferase DltB (MBOAT superfamily)